MRSVCPKCGGTNIASDGRCRPCVAARQRAYLKTEQGQKVLKAVQERYAAKYGPLRHLRPATAGVPCLKCGIVNRDRYGKCRACSAEKLRERRRSDPEFREKVRAWERERRIKARAKKDPESVRQRRFRSWDKHLRLTYGIDGEDWARMFDAQNYRCAGCGDLLGADVRAHVDHDHRTGRVRGLLCQNCNCTIGYARESIARLRALAEYLERQT